MANPDDSEFYKIALMRMGGVVLGLVARPLCGVWSAG